jgi:hypothetical protein
MSENIKITGVALDINGKSIYLTLAEAMELYKQLSDLLNKKDDKYKYIPYIPWEVTYGNPNKSVQKYTST